MFWTAKPFPVVQKWQTAPLPAGQDEHRLYNGRAYHYDFVPGRKRKNRDNARFIPVYNFSYSFRSLSLVIIFSQSLPSAFSQSGFMTIDTSIMASNCWSLRPLQMPWGMSILFFSTIYLNSFTP